MIRVWIETASKVTRAGFEAVLEGSEGIELVDAPALADVVLSDIPPQGPEDLGAVPTVVLLNEPLTARLFRRGVHAILPRDAAAEQIVAALHAASVGLIAILMEASALIIPAAPESEVETLTPREMVRLTPGLKQTVKTQLAVR